jgi:hypothetical protein
MERRQLRALSVCLFLMTAGALAVWAEIGRAHV